MVVKKYMGLGCIDKMTTVALNVPSYKASERGCRHPESKNRSTIKARFRRPMFGSFKTVQHSIWYMNDTVGGEQFIDAGETAT